MNIFIIPSWYPSESNPIYGTFNKEQAVLMGQLRPSWNVGVSRWGQGDSSFLIPIRNPLSIVRLFAKHQTSQYSIDSNVKEYFSPAFSWTRKWRNGNIEGIFRANEENLNSFIHDHGRPEVISAQATYPAALIAKRLAQKFDLPYTVTIRMSPFPFSEFLTKNGALTSMISQPLNSASRLIATSNSLKDRLSEFDLNNVRIINNPVDIEKFKLAMEEKSNATQCKVLTVGRVEDQKGIDLLLKAMSVIDAKFELRIGGAGSKISYYKKMSNDLGLRDKVKWLGQLSREEVVEEMQGCSFYVLSSRHETFGNVVVEAMSCGKPVVATKCGGPEEIVTAETGYLTDIDASDLAEKIDMMIQNFQSFDAKIIRRNALSRYAPKIWIKNLEKIFKEII
ncbi:glycosyltransferase [Ekhidna sp.]